MPKDYEVEIDVAIARIRDALLADPAFVNRLYEVLRAKGFKTTRATPGADGSSTRNPNSARVNPPRT